MTERKPAGKSWETWIEELIHNAHETGEFDDLEGAGKPIPGITDLYDPDWWVKKLLQREKLTVFRPRWSSCARSRSGWPPSGAWATRPTSAPVSPP